jgi:hypothetical protein
MSFHPAISPFREEIYSPSPSPTRDFSSPSSCSSPTRDIEGRVGEAAKKSFPSIDRIKAEHRALGADDTFKGPVAVSRSTF